MHVLLSTPEVTALKNLRLALDMFDLLGYPRHARAIVFNKSDKQAGISAAEAADILGMPVAAEVPMSSDIPASVNRGVADLAYQPEALSGGRYSHPCGVGRDARTHHRPAAFHGRRGLKLRMRSK